MASNETEDSASRDVETMMGGMTCTTWRHEARETIDEALVAGEPHRSIAEQYGLSPSAVLRHQDNHLPAVLVKAAESKELAHGTALLEQVEWLLTETKESMERSKNNGKEKDFLAGARETRHTMELVGRITGELRENNRDSAPQTAFDAIIKLASALSEAQLQRMAAGEKLEALIIEGEGYVVEPE